MAVTNGTVNVAADQAPVITLNGDAAVTLNVGEAYADAGATALDDRDGDLTADIVVGGDAVDTDTPGTYVITYNVADSSGNAATEVTRTVTVEDVDANPPVITLLGSATIRHEAWQPFTDPGATAFDAEDGDLTAALLPRMTIVDSLIGTLVGGGSLLAVAWVYQILKKREGMGGGDIKLLAMIGAFTGCAGGRPSSTSRICRATSRQSCCKEQFTERIR